jgi:hypothetical protein
VARTGRCSLTSVRLYQEISAALIAIARLQPPFHAGLVERNYRDLVGTVGDDRSSRWRPLTAD